jgi:hypothetical protein
LSLGAAGASTDLQLRVAHVVRPGEEGPDAQGLDLLGERRDIVIELAFDVGVRFERKHFFQLARALEPGFDRLERVDPPFERLYLLYDSLSGLLIVPESRLSHALLELPQRRPLDVQVKDTSVLRPAAPYRPEGLGLGRFPPCDFLSCPCHLRHEPSRSGGGRLGMRFTNAR